ncbi:flagellar basal-body MS-ring/collar protein FliF [Aurantiacibacter poecillastricola]|uniref:flagellar basal-body MS-ring/collar protein FliF n=1 Tax=Aurantiacibacter poecillastricola TaxID=3064385 RepID=UPI00273E8D7B|nr:flagellar basal-body MS-ring/collar protein FliF [Aurantiacibacter sp. 219JJ12-13]MDP5263125.1 flagellar basal-body MS-ring/collar protein FliF [Aurantiacibacter sp. 219JJ12-13]
MADAALPLDPGPTVAMPIGGGLGDRARGILAQPAVRRALPAIGGVAALAVVGALYLALAEGPQRVLYSALSDAERASVVQTLDAGGITYDIDPATGMLSVAEEDVYRARMLVASDGSLASPDNTIELLDSIPLGSSRTLEGERLRNVRERELVRTIEEINGVETARVHLASPERSVFVRENVAPSASVMLRLARGRSLSDDQVQAIVNLVAGSVPALTPEAVRVVDQSGRLLSSTGASPTDTLDLQRQFEEKLQLQVAQLLTPMIGEGNFSSQVQVQLDLSEETRARETYDDDGVVRSVSESTSTRPGETLAGGIPGVTANTPPDPAELEEGAPQGGEAAGATTPPTGQSSASRVFEVGREVAVTSTGPGTIRRISVGVALSEEALQAIQPATAEQVQQLVSAAVGADPQRGDQVTVIAGAFEPVEVVETPFYETDWFALALRYGTALLAVVLGLLFGVRPIMKALRGPQETPAEDEADDAEVIEAEIPLTSQPAPILTAGPDELREQVELARRLANEQPERAVVALRRMLATPVPERVS